MFSRRKSAHSRARAASRRRRLRVEPLEERRVLDSTVVFNEIMYHPAAADGPEADIEWFELYNQMSVNMDLSGWSIAGGVDFTFPAGTVIPGRGYLVVATNPAALEASTGFANALGPFSGRLSNSGEELRLENRDGRVLSAVDYADDGAWPVGPDGSGFSLAKRDAYSSSSDAASWTASAEQRGTPGGQNFPLPGEIVTTTLVAIGAQTSYVVPTSGALGSSWTLPAFDDSSWSAGPSGVGFDLINGSSASAGGVAANNGDNGDEDVDTVWTGGASGLWATAANWSQGVPTPGDRAFINGVGTVVTIGPGVNAEAGRVFIADASNSIATLRVTGGNLTVSGNTQRLDVGTAGRGTLEILSGAVHVLGRLNAGVDNGAANAQGTINIHGGSLVVDERILLGAGANLPLTHSLTMTGGSLTAASLFVGDGAFARAHVSMLGGTMTVGDLAIPTNYGEPGLDGHFQLDGGTVYVTNPSVGGTQNLPSGFRLANGPPNPPLNPANAVQGTLDITGGALVLAGDVRAQLDAYIAAGVLTGFGQPEFVVYDYNVSHPGYTTVTARIPSVGEWVETDIASAMHAINSSVYLRTEFGVADASAVDGLLLHVAYNDGFVAYLNGQEVARRNAPASAAWNSAATAAVADVVEETIDISAFAGALASGDANVLAFHGLNASAGDSTFVVAPRLTASLRPVGEPVLRINEIAAATQSGFWVELSNTSDQPVSLDGVALASSAGATYMFAGQSIAPGGVLVVNQAQLGWGAADGDRLFLLGPGGGRLLDARAVDTRLRGIDVDRDGQWLFPAAPTPGAANSFADHSAIVINEIMYHAAPRQPTGQTPFQESDQEWIELYNRGPVAVDLTGWALRDGIDFEFPAGLTIPAGGYLVVSNDATALAAAHPGIAIVGNFARSLSNSSDRIVLVSPDGNPADEVRYYDGGAWPGDADGGGSSLELRSPHADNARAEAWAASDETAGGVWQTFTIRQTAAADTGPVLWNEFLFGLLNDGDVLIDDVSVVSDPDGAAVQLMQNGSFSGDALGGAPAHWRIVGNHHGQVVADPDNAANKVLRLTSVGVTGHESNNAGTTFANNAAVVNGRVYEITFRARWLAGSNQLNARFYLSRVADTVYLAVPESTGTPGAQNSAFEANIGPTFRDFGHGPALPQPGESVTVSVRAADPDGVAAATLHWKTDGGAWQMVAMTPGVGGRYTASIPGHAAGTVVQFYVAASDALGATATYPGAGPNSRALYEVDDGAGPATAVDSIRVVMLAADSDRFFDPTNAMSNEFLGGTVIYNDREAFYDVGVRPKGSSRSRLDSRYWGSYNLRFQPDHLFRGVHDQVSLDSSGSSALVSFGQDEILVKQVINQAAGGLATAYDDLAYAVLPRSVQNGPIILQLARYDDLFLDESYADGSDGTVFEYELIYYPQQTVDGTPQGLKLTEPTGVVGVALTNLGDDPERYRWNFLIKNNRAADDYSALVNMAQTFALSGSAFLSAIGDVIDVDQWLRTFAVANLNGIGDSYVTGGNRHNTQFYFRPADGRALLLPWDWDVAYVQSTTAGLSLNSDLTKLIASPAYRRAYYGHLLDIIDTSFNANYLADWTLHYGALVGQNFNPHLNYVQSRGASVISQINAAVPQAAFAITTNGGNPFAVVTPTTTLAGQGWVNVRELRLAGSQQPLDVVWNSVTGWQTTVPLASGLNQLTIEAYDFQGQLIGSDTIDVTSNFSQPQQRDALRITELMYHPPDPPPGLPLDAEEFEFVEIQNISASPINLLGLTIEAAVQFTFPDITLGPGEFIVVVENPAAFASRYPGVMAIAGQYTGKLENAGELITLRDSEGQIIQSFAYGDDDWYPTTDGPGYSLVIVDATADPTTWGNAASWRPSTNRLGSPGKADPLYLDADVNQDGAVDIFDVALVSANWGGTGPAGDANHDGAVDIFDVAAISQAWGMLPGGIGATAASAPAALEALTSEPATSESAIAGVEVTAPIVAFASPTAEKRRATDGADAATTAPARIGLLLPGKTDAARRPRVADAALSQLSAAWRIRPAVDRMQRAKSVGDNADEQRRSLDQAATPRPGVRRSQVESADGPQRLSPLDADAVDALAHLLAGRKRH